MQKKDDIQHSILIVSGSEKFDALIRKSLPPGAFMSIEFRKSAAAARRCILEKYYDIVAVNIPLPDEQGLAFAADTAARLPQAFVLIVVPAEQYTAVLERVTDDGIFALAKPFPHGRLEHAIRFGCAQQKKIRLLEAKKEAAETKTEDIRIVSKAKFLLIEKRHMSEDDAHRLIGKQAMDYGVSRRVIARRIIEDLE